MTGLGQVYMMQGKHSEAEPLYVQALEGRRLLLGDEHKDTLETMGALASLYWRQGKYAQAEPVRAEVVQVQRRVLGEEHPATLTSLNNLALLHSYQGRLAEAEQQFVSVIAAMRRVLGDDHLETMISAGNLGIVYFRQGRHADAEAVFAKSARAEAARARRQASGNAHYHEQPGRRVSRRGQIPGSRTHSTPGSWRCSARCSVTIIRTSRSP